MFYGKGEVQWLACDEPAVFHLAGSQTLMSEIIRHACENQYRFFNLEPVEAMKGGEIQIPFRR